MIAVWFLVGLVVAYAISFSLALLAGKSMKSAPSCPESRVPMVRRRSPRTAGLRLTAPRDRSVTSLPVRAHGERGGLAGCSSPAPREFSARIDALLGAGRTQAHLEREARQRLSVLRRYLFWVQQRIVELTEQGADTRDLAAKAGRIQGEIWQLEARIEAAS